MSSTPSAAVAWEHTLEVLRDGSLRYAVEADRLTIDASDTGESLHTRRGFTQRSAPEEVGQRSGVVAVEVHHGGARIGIGLVVDGDLASPCAVCQNREALPGACRELVPNSHPGKLCLGNFSHSSLTLPAGISRRA